MFTHFALSFFDSAVKCRDSPRTPKTFIILKEGGDKSCIFLSISRSRISILQSLSAILGGLKASIVLSNETVLVWDCWRCFELGKWHLVCHSPCSSFTSAIPSSTTPQFETYKRNSKQPLVAHDVAVVRIVKYRAGLQTGVCLCHHSSSFAGRLYFSSTSATSRYQTHNWTLCL